MQKTRRPKLKLNKQTIAALSPDKLSRVAGGLTRIACGGDDTFYRGCASNNTLPNCCDTGYCATRDLPCQL
jgi:hypothetical protein